MLYCRQNLLSKGFFSSSLNVGCIAGELSVSGGSGGVVITGGAVVGATITGATGGGPGQTGTVLHSYT